MRERCHECFNLDTHCTCGKPPSDEPERAARAYLLGLTSGIAHPVSREWPRHAGLRLHNDPSRYHSTPMHRDVIEEAYKALGRTDE